MFQTIIVQSPSTAHFTCVNDVAKIIQCWLLQTIYLKKACPGENLIDMYQRIIVLLIIIGMIKIIKRS